MLGSRRRRRSFRSRREPSIWDVTEWHIDVNITKEIIGLIFILIGLIFLLSIFNLAGSLGEKTLKLIVYIWGFFGFIFPLAILILGINLLRRSRDDTIKASPTIGLILAFLFLPAVIPSIGGRMGVVVAGIFQSFLGTIGGAFVLTILSIISLMVAFNITISQLWSKWQGKGEKAEGQPPVKINEPKVPVFTAGRPSSAPARTQPSSQQASFYNALKGPDAAWEFPPYDLLEYSTTKAVSGNINKNVEVIQKKLRDFGIEVTMSDVNIGPTVTQYTLKPTEGVKLTQITARANDLALALAAHPIRVEAPIPGKSAVGVEVPNKTPAMVTLREVLESEEFEQSKSNLNLALGLDVAGNPFVVNLKNMPHLLIAGATGSGKSVCINGLVITMIYQNSPADLRFLLIDPKRVEFTEYNGIPHLLTPVITEVDKTVSALKWAVSEMDRRFRLFAECSRRNIEAYNENPPDGQKMPYIIIIIDELADLMAQAANEVEASIVRIAQLARAVGIHLIVATQRPSVDVITGLIKANMPTRIAFAVASGVDSRTILDISGAEKLLGKGDMLYLGGDIGQTRRVQGVNIRDQEIKAVTDFLKREGHAVYDESILSYRPTGDRAKEGDVAYDDDLYSEAKDLVTQAGKASASLLQRRLRIGYARAARLLDLMEADGVIGPADGAKPRDILVDNYPESPYGSDQYPEDQYPQNRQYRDRR